MTRGTGNWPGPPPEFVESLSDKLRVRRSGSSRSRIALALAISTALLAAIAAVGGVGAAASSLTGGSPNGTPAQAQYSETGWYCVTKMQNKKMTMKMRFGTPPFPDGWVPTQFYGSSFPQPGSGYAPCPPQFNG